MVRWPGKIKAGTVSNEIVSHLDWLPTMAAAAGDPHIKEKLLGGCTAGHKTFKVHLDGQNVLPHLTGKEAHSPRKDELPPLQKAASFTVDQVLETLTAGHGK